MTDTATTRTRFGFEIVSLQEKAQRVGRVFDRVASRYDLMNDLMSAGTHRLWKAHMVAVLNPQPGQILLDVAGGTGDIARLWLKCAGRVQRRRGGQAARAIIADFNLCMLQASLDEAGDRALQPEVLCADAQALPVPDKSVDAVSIAFGLRNVANMEQALAEFYRVLKPGGRFVCLEFSQVSNAVLRKLYDAYSFCVIPALGRIVTGEADAYRYLVESIRTFPSRSELARTLHQSGFVRVRYQSFATRAVALHSGWRV